jgi:hypothetical protein
VSMPILLILHPERAFFGLAACVATVIALSLLWLLWQYRRR